MNCGLLGRKLGHSYSPAIHAMLADYTYRLYEKEPEELEDFVRTGDFQGLNVTIPYKKAVVPCCDLLTPLARELGSVNTLVRLGDGRLLGDNTDAWGFDQMLGRVGVSCRGKKALVLGSGGASATVQAVLKLAGAEVIVISRSGVPSVLISLPLKYMHTAVETISLDTLEESARLLAHFLSELDASWEDDLWI